MDERPSVEDTVVVHGGTSVRYLANPQIAPTGGPGTIRPYAILRHRGKTYQIDGVLNTDEKVDFFDIFDESGSCLNEGDPFYVEDEVDERAGITPEILAEFIDSLDSTDITSKTTSAHW